jgi:hypothetical protein
MTKGIGYQEYRSNRIINEGLRSGDIEKPGKERYLLYFGRAHVVDHESNKEARGPLKIGRGKFATALMRGRNQPGIDFRIYAEIILDTNDATSDAEEISKNLLSKSRMAMNQNQQECYAIEDHELIKTVDMVADQIRNNTAHKIHELNIFI